VKRKSSAGPQKPSLLAQATAAISAPIAATVKAVRPRAVKVAQAVAATLQPAEEKEPDEAPADEPEPVAPALRVAGGSAREPALEPAPSVSQADAEHRAIWDRIDENTNLVARAHDLIQPGERFTLTEDQARAIEEIGARLANGGFEFLLKAPTGSGKTEVMFRTAVREALRSGGYVCLVAPTRDLVRQDCTYFRDRLEGTGLGVGEAHGGISPGERRTMLEGIASGKTRFIIGSAMMISVPPLWDVLDRSALTIIDDVNAFDEREHLRLLEDLDCPLLFASATPNELQRFLERVGAFKNTISMRGMPFDVLPTKVHKTVGVWGEPATEQLARADELIRDHLARKSRIFVIARTRGDVPKLAQRLEATYGISVQQLRGDMADSAEHKKRNRRSGVSVYGTSTRVEEMRAFREGAPAILAATNLVGSGLDIPAADLIVITDSDAFGESEIEQLIGRVGRRERPSDAVLLVETTFEKNPSRAMGASGRAQTFMPSGMRSNSLRFRRR
jgi:RecG-like helicase